jgi:hypothetical protein
MTDKTPELGEATMQLIEAVRKGGSNILLWLVMAVAGVAPVAIQQINASRGPDSVEYLQPADFQILGPDSAESGSLVRQTVSDYEPSDVCWFTVNNGEECDCQKYGAQGGDLVFAMPQSGPAEITCSIIRRGKLYLARKVVEQATPAPVEPVVEPEPVKPSPEPTPDPEPVEPKPEPLSDIAKKARKLAQDGDLDPADADALAENLREAADKSEGKNPRSLVMTTVRLNEDLDLPEEVTEGIQVLLQTLAENGDMINLEQHLEVWRQMAAGFEAYASE